MKHLNTTALGLAAAGLIFPSAVRANLITNGSFENGSFAGNTDNTMVLNSGDSSTLTGWTVTDNSLAWINTPNPFGLTASEGSYFLDLSGYHDNQPYAGVAASTGFQTVIGQRYEIAFDLGSDRLYDNTAPSVALSVNGQGVYIATAGAITDNVQNRWETFKYVFQATSGSTVVSFSGTPTADGNKYIGLDKVVVTAVPEPATMIAGALLLLPFSLSTVRILRKNQKA